MEGADVCSRLVEQRPVEQFHLLVLRENEPVVGTKLGVAFN